jgi:hypothetical protein
MKTPLAIAKEKFGDKAKLVAAVEAFTGDDLWVARTNERKGLKHVSNAKLLRLVATFTAVKDKFGTRAKLIDAILDFDKRSKDEGLRTRLSKYPVPRLWDMYSASAKRHSAVAPKATKAAGSPARSPAPHADTKAAPKKAAAKAPAKKAAPPKDAKK